MHTSIGNLRLHIKTVLKEMPMMGAQAPSEDSTVSTKGDEPWEDEILQKNRRQVNRFFKQQKFVDDAIKLYRNLSVPIYVIPFWSNHGGLGSKNSRSSAVAGDSTATLARCGVSPERAIELENERRVGAALFLVSAKRLEENSMPTPWMIVHVMFDSKKSKDNIFHQTPELARIHRKIELLLSKFDGGEMIDIDLRDLDDDVEFPQFTSFVSSLTMGSARKGAIYNHNDATAEIMVQSALTQKGFTYNESKDAAVNAVLAKVTRLCQEIKPAFERSIAGKMHIIQVL